MSLLYEVIYVFDDTITKPKINWFPCAEAKKVKSRKAEEDYITSLHWSIISLFIIIMDSKALTKRISIFIGILNGSHQRNSIPHTDPHLAIRPLILEYLIAILSCPKVYISTITIGFYKDGGRRAEFKVN